MKLSDYFEEKGWDQHDTMAFGFSDCTLKRDWFGYTKGTVFDYIYINFESGEVVFTVGQVETTYNMKIEKSDEP